MFLTEGTKLNTAPAVSASPTTGWQMLYESEMVWHKLEMGMTRLEHSAIVREDHSLLQEGVKEFFTKAKKWFQWAGQEFLRYLDKVIDTWTNIQNKIRTWLIDAESIKKKLDNGKKVTVPAWVIYGITVATAIAQKSDSLRQKMDKIRDDADKADSDNEDFGSHSHSQFKTGGREAGGKLLANFIGISIDYDKLNSNYEESAPLAKETLLHMLNFCKDGRPKVVKTLQYIRNSYAKLINSGIRAADAESDEVKSIKKASSKFREVCNRLISFINKVTNAAISALGKLRDTPKEGKFENQKGAAAYFFN